MYHLLLFVLCTLGTSHQRLSSSPASRQGLISFHSSSSAPVNSLTQLLHWYKFSSRRFFTLHLFCRMVSLAAEHWLESFISEIIHLLLRYRVRNCFFLAKRQELFFDQLWDLLFHFQLHADVCSVSGVALMSVCWWLGCDPVTRA